MHIGQQICSAPLEVFPGAQRFCCAMPTRLVPLAEPPVARIETTMQQLVGCVSPVDELGPSRWALLDDSPDDASSSSAAFDPKTPVPDDSVDAVRLALSRRAASMSALSGDTMPSGGAASPKAPCEASPNATRGRRTSNASWDFFSRGGMSGDGGGSLHAGGGGGGGAASPKTPCVRRTRRASRSSWDLFSGRSSDDGVGVPASPSPLIPIFVNLGGVGGQQGQRQKLAVAGCVLQLSAQCEYGDAAGVGGRDGDTGATKPAPRKSDDSFMDWHDTQPHHTAAKLLLTTIASPLVMTTKEIEADGHKCIWNQTFRIELPCDALTTTATTLRIDLSARAHHGGLVRAASGRVALSEVRRIGREVGRARHASGGLASRVLVAAQKSPAFFIRVHRTKPRRSTVCFEHVFVVIIIAMSPRSAARQGRYEVHRPAAPLAR